MNKWKKYARQMFWIREKNTNIIFDETETSLSKIVSEIEKIEGVKKVIT